MIRKKRKKVQLLSPKQEKLSHKRFIHYNTERIISEYRLHSKDGSIPSFILLTEERKPLFNEKKKTVYNTDYTIACIAIYSPEHNASGLSIEAYVLMFPEKIQVVFRNISGRVHHTEIHTGR